MNPSCTGTFNRSIRNSNSIEIVQRIHKNPRKRHDLVWWVTLDIFINGCQENDHVMSARKVQLSSKAYLLQLSCGFPGNLDFFPIKLSFPHRSFKLDFSVQLFSNMLISFLSEIFQFQNKFDNLDHSLATSICTKHWNVLFERGTSCTSD